MTMPHKPFKRTLRGMEDTRTVLALRDVRTAPYNAYLKIGFLEMKRARWLTVKHSMVRNVREIEARFKEIDAEKAALLRLLGESIQASPAGSSVGNSSRSAARRGTGTFPIKY